MPLLLEHLTPTQEYELCKSLHETQQKLNTARKTRQNEWMELERILGMRKDRKPRADDPVQPIINPNENVIATHTVKGIQSTTKESMPLEKYLEDTIQSYTYTTLRTLHTALITSMFPVGQSYLNVDRFDQVEPSQAESLQKFMRDLFHLMDYKSALNPIVSNLLKYGTSIDRYQWETEERTVWTKTADLGVSFGRLQPTYTQTKKVVYNAPRLTPLPIMNVWYDTTVTFDKALLIIKKDMTGSQLLETPEYRNRKIYERIQRDRTDVSPEEYEIREIKTNMNLYQEIAAAPDTGKKVTIYEAWGDFNVGNRFCENYVLEFTTDALKVSESGKAQNQYSILRFEPNPYKSARKPFILSNLDLDAQDPYPKSPLELALPHYRNIAKLEAIVKDISATAAGRPLLYEQGAFTKESLEILAKGVITKDMALAVTQTQAGGIANAMIRMQDNQAFQVEPLLQHIETLRGQAQAITGETSAMSGGQAPQYMKTGVAMAYEQGALNRLTAISNSIETGVTQQVFKKTLEYLDQFLLPSVGENGEQKPALIVTHQGSRAYDGGIGFEQLGWKMAVTGASFTATKQLETNNLMQFLQTLSNPDILGQIGVAPLLRLVKQIAAKLGISDVDDFIPEDKIIKQSSPRLTLWDKITGKRFVDTPPAPAPPAPPQSPEQAVQSQMQNIA